MSNGALVISLDFELLWGVFDKVDWREKKEYFHNTREVIPEIIKLFEEHEISCTWATVGMLFNNDWDEWNANIPDKIPKYENERLSAYTFGKSIQSKETEELCFAPDLVKLIQETSNQEIATHTYSHYYCLEPGQEIEAFNADLKKTIELASNFGVELNSLVFPRNQYNPEYLEVCEILGIRTVRTNPENWYWQNTQNDSLAQKIFRTGDAYIGLFDKSYKASDISCFSQKITGQKASRLLRPYSKKIIINKLKLKRIFEEMEYAAKMGEHYHLWWHPHNFGGNPLENIKELQQILKKFSILKNKYGFCSKNMISIN